ncbi:MAG: hypothetical protein JNJ83_08855 [Verrucomicrobiaceae bacterium]|nr:hypothetical protein [Verrucomicrobiaceae bacterium]
MNAIGCNNFTVICPTGWSEVIFSDDEENPVPTWEKSGGVGAVKFTVAHYAGGEPPNIGRDFLVGQLNKFPEVFDLRWRSPAEWCDNPAGGWFGYSGIFESDKEFVKVWNLSDGDNYCYATYTCPREQESSGELQEADELMASFRFCRIIGRGPIPQRG